MAVTSFLTDTKPKLLEAALSAIRAKGYSATTVDDICAVAGISKGAFFYYFRSKEELAVAAADYWGEVTSRLFASAAYRTLTQPPDRLLAYVDFRKAIMQGKLPEFTCLVGTMVQEVYDTHPAIREACDNSISVHAATLESDIAEVMRMRGIKNAEWSPKSLALYIQAVIQGAFILAKAKGCPEVAIDSLNHLRRYIELLFIRPKS